MIPLCDGDIIAFSCAAISDVKQYKIWNPIANSYHVERFKKRMDAFCEDNSLNKKAIQTVFQPSPLSFCLHAMKLKIECVAAELGVPVEIMQIFLSDSSNYRHTVYSEYKANRVKMRTPEHLKKAKKYLVHRWDAKILPEHEADDLLGIIQTQHLARDTNGNLIPENCKTIICTLDKDLDMIPGWHYNWNKKKKYFVDDITSWRTFFKQVLTGDGVDNIPGIRGIGPKTAEKLIGSCTDVKAMGGVCYREWDKYLKVTDKPLPWGTDTVKTICNVSSLLWIKRRHHKGWFFELTAEYKDPEGINTTINDLFNPNN